MTKKIGDRAMLAVGAAAAAVGAMLSGSWLLGVGPAHADPNWDCGTATIENCGSYLVHANNMRITVPGGDDELLALGLLACKVDPTTDNMIAAEHAVYAAEPSIGLDLSQIKYPLKGDDAKYNGASEINSLAHIWLCPAS